MVGQIIATAQDACRPTGHDNDALAGNQGRVWQVECAVDSIEIAVTVQYVLQITRPMSPKEQRVQEGQRGRTAGTAISGLLDAVSGLS